MDKNEIKKIIVLNKKAGAAKVALEKTMVKISELMHNIESIEIENAR